MKSSKVPKHIGIIMDGNRRFAKRLMAKPWKGHEWGAEKVRTLLEWCLEYGIKEATFYAFSIENFDRPKKEFNYLMDLFEAELKKIKHDDRVYDDKIRFNFIGRIHLFPDKVKNRMKDLMKSTQSHKNFIVNFAMAYGGRAEIIDATKKIAKQIKEGKLDIDDINEQVFTKNTYLESEPDLIIRTSEKRLSGFLLWQGSYAEIQFLPNILWPEFSKEHFTKCLEDYANRNRRFGK